MQAKQQRLYINIDHVATLRQARRGAQPDPIDAALAYEAAGADGITAHLREDRRHIQDADVERLKKSVRTYFNLEDESIKITCNLFADHLERQREIERFWLETLGLPPSSLCKSTINVYSKYSKKKRMNKLPYGTCRVVVSRTRIVQSIFGSIQEYAGFERPAWLE